MQGSEILDGEVLEDTNKDKVKMKPKPISDKGRDRIERLIDDKTKQSQLYLDTLKGYAEQAITELPFSKQLEVDELEKEKLIATQELEDKDSQKAEKIAAVKLELDDQFEVRKRKLQRALEILKERESESLKAATDVVENEMRIATNDLRAKLSKAISRLKELEKIKNTEIILRKAALSANVSKLTMELGDQKNKAVERLWTSVESTTDAGDALKLLPDASLLRERVSPQVFFEIFNKFVDQSKALEDKTMFKCKYCGSDAVKVDVSSQIWTCTSCSKRNVIDVQEVVKPMDLPSLSDILKNSNDNTQNVSVKMLPDQVSNSTVIENNLITKGNEDSAFRIDN